MRNANAVLLMVVGGFLGGRAVEAAESLALLPQPLRMVRKVGEFALNRDTAILVDKDSTDAASVGKQLAERIRHSTGFDLAVTPSDGKTAIHHAIALTAKNADAALGAEGYTLDVTADGVAITATAGSGLFYGTQTLLQLLPPQVFSPTKAEGSVAWAIPAVRIEDRPRFRWRGLLLDVARHFFNKEEVKNYLDLMAQHKFNTLHVHLTDDQGWRVEIKRYPKLTRIGAWRKDIGFGLDPKQGTAYGSDGRYGGFYTPEDVREIVAYAKARYVTVVPEIEMPGHAGAALSVYPELSCSGGPFDINVAGGIFRGIYCPGNEAAFAFLQNVLSEVLELFPSKRICICGDEVPKDNWRKCGKCQARMRAENLKNEDELQSYFVRRIEKYLNAHGRILVGADEILEGGLAPNATVFSWRGMGGGIAAANAGHDVIMIPISHCYFDYYQAKAGEPKAIGGFLPLETVYSFEPIPPSIAVDRVKHILGTGGCLWSEYFPNYAHVQYMTYPRACAMAEVTWTDPERKKWEDFRNRLDTHLQRLRAQGVNYRRPRQTDNAPGNSKP
jgi:hexosaminidase